MIKNISRFLAPSILNMELTKFTEQICQIESGGADWIHCDIMDGRFVPSISFGSNVVSCLRNLTNLFIDVHLMVDEPEHHIKHFVDAGADLITIHQETSKHISKVIELVKAYGCRVGIALNPATSLCTLDYVLEKVDLVLLMSVNPGLGGQNFMYEIIDKLEKLNAIKTDKNLDFVIQIDGGVNFDNFLEIKNKGCNSFVIGSAIFKSGDIVRATRQFKSML